MTHDTSTFRRFLLAAGLTNLGDGIATLAWTWLATQLTRDPFLIALMPVALRLPWFLFAIPAGLVTDRVQRKRLLLAMDVTRGLAFGLAAACIWQALPLAPPPAEGASDPLLFTALALCAAVIGVAEVFRDTAAQTVLPSIVDHRRLEIANAPLLDRRADWQHPSGAGGRRIPGRCGAALALRGQCRGLPPGGNADRPADHPATRRGSGAASLAPRAFRGRPLSDGRADPAAIGCLHRCFQHVAPDDRGRPRAACAREPGPFCRGFRSGALGRGAWGDPCRAGRRVPRGPLRRCRVAQAASLACSGVFGLLLVVESALGLSVALMLFSFFGLLWDTVSVSFRQRAVPDAVLGRVNALYRLCSWGMMPVGLALSGLVVDLAEEIVPRETALLAPFLIASLGVLLLTLLAWRGIGRGFSRQPGQG